MISGIHRSKGVFELWLRIFLITAIFISGLGFRVYALGLRA